MKKGFTLIELLVVILIIGILAAVALPQYRRAVIRSRYSSLKALTRSLANAQEIFYLANGAYTVQLGELSVNIPGITREVAQGVDGNTYQFQEGECTLWYSYVQCVHNKVAIAYGIFYQNSPTNPGKQLCRTSDRNLDFVCKQDSGSVTPTVWQNTNKWRWIW